MKSVLSLRGSQWLVITAAVMMLTMGLWAAESELAQIARAQGQVIAVARTQVIQSANDGVIEALHVREGQRVSKGQVLLRLDSSQAKAAYEDSLGKVAALQAALVRLEAEVLGRPLVFPKSVLAYPAFTANQRELFQRRQNALKAEIAALSDSLRLVNEELDLSLPLLATGDVGKSEVIRLQRQVAEINGQITNRRNKFFQDAQAEMTKTQEELATQEHSLAERTSTLERMEIVAPVNGLVNSIAITTHGARVRPGDVVMQLLPTESDLVIEAKLRPADIAHVRKDLPSAIKLDAFDYSIYGVLQGKVDYISPDALTERTPTGEHVYYRVQISINQEELARRNLVHSGRAIEVQPGMTATVEISTGQQTVLAYLTKPVSKTFSESLGER